MGRPGPPPKDRDPRIRAFACEQRDRVAYSYRWAVSQPSWVARAGLLAFLLVVGLPILLLIGLAVLAGVVVFGGLALLNAAVNKLRGLPPARDGRENVRVIRRQ